MSANDHSGSGNSGNGGAKPQSDDVRDMLRQLASQIKDQIADVDRRHNAALKDMETRIQTVPAVAPPARMTAAVDDPWDVESAEALTRLYEGAPETPPLVKMPAATVAQVAPSQTVFFSDPPLPPPAALVPVEAPRAVVVKAQATVPPKAAAPVAPSRVTPPAAAPVADKPVVAKAEVAAPMMAAMAPMIDAALAPPPAPTPTLVPAAVALSSLAADRDWLDARLADLHEKVETTLSGFDPSPIILPVTERIDALETTVIKALNGVAQKSDLERFAGLETEVAAIKGHVEAARDQLKRLNDIEEHLRDLTAIAVEQQEAEVPAAVMPEMPDFHSLAEKAAERAAQHVVEQHKEVFSVASRAQMHVQAQPTQAGPSLDEMQALLDGYTAEHRREQSQTAATLTTMQEALIRLIDRIEELAGEPPEAEAAAEAAQQFVEVQDERGQQAGRRVSDRQAMAEAQQAQAQAQAMAAQQAAAQHAAAQQRASQPRAAALPDPAEAPADSDAMTAAQAMAAERARVMAERGQAPRRAPSARPQVQVAPDTDEVPPPKRASRPAKAASSSMPKRLLAISGLAAACLVGGFLGYSFLTKRAVETAKQSDRLPKATPAIVVPSAPPAPAARPNTPRVETPGLPETAPRATTPALPEALPSREVRPQPTSSAPLPAQPAPREAPTPRAVETPEVPAKKVRPVPETVTDDLSSNTQPPTAFGAPVSTAALHGIALDNSALMPDPAELARRQSSLAPLEVQGQPTPVAATTAEPAMPSGRPELPPAQIGPMSLRVAAQQGDPSAAFEVAARFAEAKGVKQDFQQALYWYSRSAQQGYVPAQYRLATIYEGGLNGTADLGRAKVWYKRAADQGNVKAMHNLAVLSAGTTQGQPDYQTAAKWFTEAADRGLADSQFNLGVLHESGLGVPKDQLQAYKWFALAARSGDKEAIRRRDQLMASFTPQVAGSADKVVQAWRAKPTDLKANDPRAATMAWQAQQGRLQEQAMAQMQAAPVAAQPVQALPPGVPAGSKVVKAPVQRTTASVPAPR